MRSSRKLILVALAAVIWSIYDPRAQHHDQILLDGSKFCSCCRSTFFNLCPTQMHWKTIIIILVSGPFASTGIWNGFEILQCLPAFLPKLSHSLGKNGIRGMLTSIIITTCPN